MPMSAPDKTLGHHHRHSMAAPLAAYKLLLDRIGDDFAGDRDIDRVLLVREDGEHDEQVAHGDAALGHVLIFSSLYCRRFVCDTEVEARRLGVRS
jgi:hypothetical protein